MLKIDLCTASGWPAVCVVQAGQPGWLCARPGVISHLFDIPLLFNAADEGIP